MKKKTSLLRITFHKSMVDKKEEVAKNSKNTDPKKPPRNKAIHGCPENLKMYMWLLGRESVL